MFRAGIRRLYSTAASGSVLVVVEHSGGQVLPTTLSTITAAQKLGKVTALVAGSNTDLIAKTVSSIEGVSQVITSESKDFEHGLAEVYAPLIVETQKKFNFSHILSPHSAFGKNILPRVAALLDMTQISDIISVQSSDTFTRPIYAGNALVTVKCEDPVKIVTVRPTSFPKAKIASPSAPIQSFSPSLPANDKSKWISTQLNKSDRPSLSTASKVISAGRAIKSAENFKIIFDLADKMNAAVGASRAACDAGYISHDYQIGQTGQIVAPDLYLAFGISGAIQHVAGMKDSKVIAVVNKDPEAPFFQIADVGLVDDLFNAVPEMTKKLSK